MKKVTIHIAKNDLKHLNSSNYKLCFAKKIVGKPYNIVWQAYPQYLSKNFFSWSHQYKVFGSQTFRDKARVKIATESVAIKVGETITLDRSGIFSSPKTEGPTTDITINNQYGWIHVGLSQISLGINDKKEVTPIYLTAKAIVKGRIEFTPIDKVLVWFEQQIQTSTMFSRQPPQTQAISCATELDLSQKSCLTACYKNQEWSIEA